MSVSGWEHALHQVEAAEDAGVVVGHFQGVRDAPTAAETKVEGQAARRDDLGEPGELVKVKGEVVRLAEGGVRLVRFGNTIGEAAECLRGRK